MRTTSIVCWLFFDIKTEVLLFEMLVLETDASEDDAYFEAVKVLAGQGCPTGTWRAEKCRKTISYETLTHRIPVLGERIG